MAGIEYKVSGEDSRGVVSQYHRKPQPRIMNQGAHSTDIAFLKPAERKNTISGSDSRFTIGFEVEKNSLHRNAVKEYPLFCGFELDSSCGYEAVTNVLPLVGRSHWRTKVYNMMVEAEQIIDDSYSPSDRRCSGHMTVTVKGMEPYDVIKLVRKNIAIFYAIFRGRLTNSYCNTNLTCLSYNDACRRGFNGGRGRYYAMLDKDFPCFTADGRRDGYCGGFELRIPSRISSVKQMMRRYELMYEVVNFSINSPNGSFESLLKKVQPIILSMYNGDVAKTEEIIELSRHMRKFIMTGKVNKHVHQWVDPQNNYANRQDAECRNYVASMSTYTNN